MKKSSPSLSAILAIALAVIAGGAFCFLFFPWPLWLIVWGLFSIVGLVQILAPTRADTQPQADNQLTKGDFSGFDDKIKWDKFSALDQAGEKSSWAKDPATPVAKKPVETNKDKPDKGPSET
ncbi:MAG: hypothetical protein QMD09_13045 [Desulfatibacillaceae bacterium]|nr:hypothetical protein [Desulfatibacillaceae bacterium]